MEPKFELDVEAILDELLMNIVCVDSDFEYYSIDFKGFNKALAEAQDKIIKISEVKCRKHTKRLLV